jgi:hypothetical protein
MWLFARSLIFFSLAASSFWIKKKKKKEQKLTEGPRLVSQLEA